MRNFMRIVSEAPIMNWEIDPKFSDNEVSMLAKSPDQRLHWSDPDKRAISDPANVQKISMAFRNVKAPFSIYFWQIPDPDYDPYLQRGEVDQKWLKTRVGKDVAAKVQRPDVINILMTNNLSDENPIGMRSPWMVGHRITHALTGTTDILSDKFDRFIQRTMQIGYDITWPSVWKDGYNFYTLLHGDYISAFGLGLGHHLGTMKSARTGTLNNNHEWYYETFTQYLMTGKVRFNPLPENFDDLVLTTDPVKREKLQIIWEKFPAQLERMFRLILKQSIGKTFVI